MTKVEKTKKNKIFGYFFTSIFILIGIWPKIFYDNEINLSYLILSSVLFAITFLRPNFYTIPNILWIKFGFLLGRFIAPIVMLCIYFFLVFPINLILKFMKKDILELKQNDTVKTYWKKRENEYNSMDNQF
tara:strand:+ start:1100 stop:1492 length:393 start_codon:yes stop_codon:yes gene_type:complete